MTPGPPLGPPTPAPTGHPLRTALTGRLRSHLDVDSDADAAAASGPMPESPAWNATAHTLSPLVLFGGLGWLGDRLLGVTALLPVGLFVGVAAGLALLWVRYGTHQSPSTPPPANVEPGGPSRDSRRIPHDDRRPPEEDE